MNKVFTVVIFFTLLACSGKQGAENSTGSGIDLDAQLEKFEARKQYSCFTRDNLESIPDSEIEQAIVDYISEHVLEDDEVANYASFKKLSPGFRAVYSTIIVEDLVCSNGFADYFTEPESLYVEDAVEGFRLLGAAEPSRIASMAMVIARESRRPGEADEKLSQLDTVFAKSCEPASGLRIRYIRKNPSMFITKK